jgi:hypothetical protein
VNNELENQLGKICYEAYHSPYGASVSWEQLAIVNQTSWMVAGKAVFTAFVYSDTDSRAVNGPETILATRDYVHRYVKDVLPDMEFVRTWFSELERRIMLVETEILPIGTFNKWQNQMHLLTSEVVAIREWIKAIQPWRSE